MGTISRYISFPIVTNARDRMAGAWAYLQSKFPGWTPSEGQLDTAIIEAVMGEIGDLIQLAASVPDGIFRAFGAQLFNLQPLDASSASTTSTWFLTDNAGHTIAAGTQVSIKDADGNEVAFVVLADVVVPAGNTQTTAGQVTLIAVTPGAASSGIGSIGGAATLIDSITWVDHITIAAATAGGQDAETDQQYMDRLALELTTLSPRPILPRDFAILARNVSGVQRAAAVDGYNPGDATYNNERMITIVALDANGAPVGTTVKTAIQTYLDAMREINFVVHTTDAIISQVDVTTHVKLASGYSASDVQARIVSNIQAYLDPKKWGIDRNDDPNDPQTWNNITIIRYDDLVWIVRGTPGVDYIVDLTVGLHGGAMSAADLNLTGVVPLPNYNTITAVAS